MFTLTIERARPAMVAAGLVSDEVTSPAVLSISLGQSTCLALALGES